MLREEVSLLRHVFKHSLASAEHLSGRVHPDALWLIVRQVSGGGNGDVSTGQGEAGGDLHVGIISVQILYITRVSHKC